ncbi:hypothetical protein C8J56DRAFT_1026363 [Mycena floridula]|nr:hypothetical protein C8J56DRAFT_1026363 [Mycena floridula]
MPKKRQDYRRKNLCLLQLVQTSLECFHQDKSQFGSSAQLYRGIERSIEGAQMRQATDRSSNSTVQFGKRRKPPNHLRGPRPREKKWRDGARIMAKNTALPSIPSKAGKTPLAASIFDRLGAAVARSLQWDLGAVKAENNRKGKGLSWVPLRSDNEAGVLCASNWHGIDLNDENAALNGGLLRLISNRGPKHPTAGWLNESQFSDAAADNVYRAFVTGKKRFAPIFVQHAQAGSEYVARLNNILTRDFDSQLKSNMFWMVVDIQYYLLSACRVFLSLFV